MIKDVIEVVMTQSILNQADPNTILDYTLCTIK